MPIPARHFGKPWRAAPAGPRPVVLWAMVLLALPAATLEGAQSGGDTLVLEENLDIEIRSSTLAHVRYLKRTVVNTRRGADEYTRVFVDYTTPYVTVRKLEATVTPPSGKPIVHGKADAADRAAHASYVLYDDSRRRSLGLRGVVPGATVDYTYELEVRNLVYLEDRFWLQNDEEARSRTLTVRVPAGFPIRLAASGDTAGMQYSRQTQAGALVHRWSVRDVPSIRRDDNAPPTVDLVGTIHIEPSALVWGERRIDASTWDGIARFYLEIAQERMRPTPEVARAAQEATQGSGAEDRARRVYEFVQRKINYVAIALGIGGWQPHASGDVLRHMYGDCKDKTTLMIAMLESLGVEAYPALILTRDHGLIDPNIPALSFNHAIVAMPQGDGYLFADPTSKGTPYGEIPWWDQDASTLVVTPEGKGRFLRSPLAPADRNRRDVAIDASVDASGNIHGTLLVRARGARRDALAYIGALDEQRRDQAIHRLLNELVPGAEFGSYAIQEEGTPGTMILRVPLVLRGFVTRAGPVDILSPHLIRFPDLGDIMAPAERRHPIFFEHLYEDSATLRLELPPGRRPRTLPETRVVEGPGIAAGTRYTLEDAPATLVVESTLTVSRREIPIEDHARVRPVLDYLTGQRSQGITLRPPS